MNGQSAFFKLSEGGSSARAAMLMYAPKLFLPRRLYILDAITWASLSMAAGGVEIKRKMGIWLGLSSGMDVRDGELSNTMLDNILAHHSEAYTVYMPD